MVLIDFKGYFQAQKGPIWTFVIYLGQYLRNGACCDQYLYEAHTNSYMIFQLTLCHLIGLKVKSRSQTFQGVVSHKWYII